MLRARRCLADTPFPFPWAQLVLTLLLLFTFTCPFLIVAFINARPLGIVLNVITVEVCVPFWGSRRASGAGPHALFNACPLACTARAGMTSGFWCWPDPQPGPPCCPARGSRSQALAAQTYWAMNEVARDLEDCYLYEPNDLPLARLQVLPAGSPAPCVLTRHQLAWPTQRPHRASDAHAHLAIRWQHTPVRPPAEPAGPMGTREALLTQPAWTLLVLACWPLFTLGLCVQYQMNQRLVAAANAQLPMYGPGKDFTYDARQVLQRCSCAGWLVRRADHQGCSRPEPAASTMQTDIAVTGMLNHRGKRQSSEPASPAAPRCAPPPMAPACAVCCPASGCALPQNTGMHTQLVCLGLGCA